jgi:anti-anti-sigma factor
VASDEFSREYTQIEADIWAPPRPPQEYVRIERDPSVLPAPGRATFIVSGELDIGNVDRLTRAIAPDAVPGAHLVLDLSRLEFMDCSGIRALIEILTAIGPDGRLLIKSPSRAVRRVLELAGAECFAGLVIVNP